MSIFIESRYKVIWRSKVEIDHTVWSIPSHNLLRVNAKIRLSVTSLMKSKRGKVATITLCKLKLKKYILYLILSIDTPLYQEGCYIDCQQSLMLNKSLNTQVRWVKHSGHTHSTSHWTRKNQRVQFPKLEGPVCPLRAIFQIPGGSVPKPDVSVSIS